MGLIGRWSSARSLGLDRGKFRSWGRSHYPVGPTSMMVKYLETAETKQRRRIFRLPITYLELNFYDFGISFLGSTKGSSTTSARRSSFSG